MNMGKALRYYRENLGYSTKQVAEYLNVSIDTYNRYETGKTPVRLFRVMQIGRLLGYTKEQFITTAKTFD